MEREDDINVGNMRVTWKTEVVNVTCLADRQWSWEDDINVGNMGEP